ncbi:MAG: hypothetical protein II042_04235, partial [Erysipelotrichaceae bacterium]|nr:hypothetical protein [Erysipelotrichaceae bacterium]
QGAFYTGFEPAKPLKFSHFSPFAVNAFPVPWDNFIITRPFLHSNCQIKDYFDHYKSPLLNYIRDIFIIILTPFSVL